MRVWKKGYDPDAFTHYNSRWIFFIDDKVGHCVYWMLHVDMGSHRQNPMLNADAGARDRVAPYVYGGVELETLALRK